MKEKIQQIANDTLVLIDTELPKQDRAWRKSRIITYQKKIYTEVGKLPSHRDPRRPISHIEQLIKKAKRMAKKLNTPSIVVEQVGILDTGIVIHHFETDEDVFNRLSEEYESLVNEIKINKKREYELYLELKAKYDNQ